MENWENKEKIACEFIDKLIEISGTHDYGIELNMPDNIIKVKLNIDQGKIAASISLDEVYSCKSLDKLAEKFIKEHLEEPIYE